jgi:hypothetical protein
MFDFPHDRPWPGGRAERGPHPEVRSYVPLIVRRALRSRADISPLACWIRKMAQRVERVDPEAVPTSGAQLHCLVAQLVSRRLEQRKRESISVALQDTVRA